MKLFLVDMTPNMVAAWKEQFKDCPDVVIHHGSIFDIKDQCQCFVSPANSWGWMNGGIDLRYSEFFGWDLQRRLQELLKNKHQGELLIGQAEILPTGHSQVTHLISAPTMRVPETLVDSANAFLASRAALKVAKEAKLSSVAFPGMGTGVGRLPVRICAKQMRAAYDEVILGKIPQYRSLSEACAAHYDLVSDN